MNMIVRVAIGLIFSAALMETSLLHALTFDHLQALEAFRIPEAALVLARDANAGTLAGHASIVTAVAMLYIGIGLLLAELLNATFRIVIMVTGTCIGEIKNMVNVLIKRKPCKFQ